MELPASTTMPEESPKKSRLGRPKGSGSKHGEKWKSLGPSLALTRTRRQPKPKTQYSPPVSPTTDSTHQAETQSSSAPPLPSPNSRPRNQNIIPPSGQNSLSSQPTAAPVPKRRKKNVHLENDRSTGTMHQADPPAQGPNLTPQNEIIPPPTNTSQVFQPPTASPILNQSNQSNNKPCSSVESGNFGRILSYAGKSLAHTSRTLLTWASEPDGGMSSFLSSSLSKTSNLVLPYRKMILRKLPNKDEFEFAAFSEECSNIATGRRKRCESCHSRFHSAKQQLNGLHQPIFRPCGGNTAISNIVADEKQAEYEIRRLREELGAEKRKVAELQKKIDLNNCDESGVATTRQNSPDDNIIIFSGTSQSEVLGSGSMA